MDSSDASALPPATSTPPPPQWATPPARTPVRERFAGKVAIVTGSTHGIGLAIALELLREGARVVASSLPADAAAGAAAFAAEGFADVPIVAGDLAEAAFCETLVEAALSRFGRVDLLVNNAFSFLGGGLEAPVADFALSFAIGPIAFARLIQLCAARGMTEGGSVVNISSISAHIAQPGRWPYLMNKGAVSQLTRGAALDLGRRGIRVNAVSPAWTWTREVDKACSGDRAAKAEAWGAYSMLGRLAHTIEVARPVLFLLSDDASFITGADLDVSGGYLAMGPEGDGRGSSFASTR
jgi:NAD(P)-dependent dehydrogenase (short-subunit alcohol dehydrogenase family)